VDGGGASLAGFGRFLVCHKCALLQPWMFAAKAG